MFVLVKVSFFTTYLGVIKERNYAFHTAQNLKFSIADFPVNVTKFTVFCGFGNIYSRNSQFPADLVTFTEEIFNGKLCFCALSLFSHIVDVD